METRNWAVGDKIESGPCADAVVTFVGEERVGITWGGGTETLVLRKELDRAFFGPLASLGPKAPAPPWPASTFVQEAPGTAHYLGSHWKPFVENTQDLLGRLPEIFADAQVQTGYVLEHEPTRPLPPEWTVGYQMVWPSTVSGVTVVLRVVDGVTEFASCFPFNVLSGCNAITLVNVKVWEGGVEAQITARLGEGEVTFFDTQYTINRTWYEVGRKYLFNLLGLAYDAGPAKVHEWTVRRSPDELAWLKAKLKEGEDTPEAEYKLSTEGASVFLPVDGWDADDYSFQAPVKSVHEFTDWLGQDGWQVRATVMRFDDDDEANLDIFITRRVWAGSAPPQVGQNISGRLWLQGFLAHNLSQS